ITISALSGFPKYGLAMAGLNSASFWTIRCLCLLIFTFPFAKSINFLNLGMLLKSSPKFLLNMLNLEGVEKQSCHVFLLFHLKFLNHKLSYIYLIIFIYHQLFILHIYISFIIN